MDCPTPDVLARMPLAEAVLLFWRSIADEERLQAVWNQHRGRCYEWEISFPVMVQLVADALLDYDGSGRRSFEAGIEQGTLTASVQAAFKKLGRLPIAVSQAFLREGSTALQELFPEWAQWRGPQSLRGLRVVIVDGKAIKHVAKRLKPLRGCASGLLGGRALVAIDWTTELVIAMHAHPDGDANDVGFVRDLAPVVRQQLSGPRLWVGDRAFCDLVQTAHFTAAAGDHFLVRYAKRTPFVREVQPPQRIGRNEQHQTIVESWGWLGAESNKGRRYVRTIELQRADAESIILVTDLLDADQFPAEDLLWLYRERWGIERVFQKVTEVFGLSGLIGGTPQASVFQFAFCLLLYNMLQTLRGYIAQAQDREPDTISLEKLFEDVEQELTAWNVMIDPPATVAYFAHRPTPAETRQRVTTLLADRWRDRWIKSPPQARHAKTPHPHTRTHSSVHRILKPPANSKIKPNKPRPRCLQQ